jgi:two-component system, NtrC family, response regulator AtoC
MSAELESANDTQRATSGAASDLRSGGAMRRVLIADDESNLRHMLQLVLSREGYETISVSNVAAAIAELDHRTFDIVITDLRMPGQSGLELVDEIHKRRLQTTVVVMTAYGSRDVAIEAMKRGAYDYLSKPFDNDELILLLRKAEERERLFRENHTLRKQLDIVGNEADSSFAGMVARSDSMRSVFATIRKVGEFKTTVLVQGESGTGKELVAHAIHTVSPRVLKPFVAMNCGAIPDHLLESELFGHVRGAFTDAVRDRIGLFEQADGGTLFLDEIGELSPALQVKLLRVLQEGEIRRLGDTQSIEVDVRVVAATVRDLESDVKRGRFREDLFYRLNVVAIDLPPLRQRREDIPLLVEHFLSQMAGRMGLRTLTVEPDAMQLLAQIDWPGNVRQLANCIERALVLSDGATLTRSAVLAGVQKTPAISQSPVAAESASATLKDTMRKVEQGLIQDALNHAGENRTKAAKILGISHRTLLYKIKEYGIPAAGLSAATGDGELDPGADDFGENFDS